MEKEKKEFTNADRVGVWIDTEKACIIALDGSLRTVRSDKERHRQILTSKLGGLHGGTPSRSEKQERTRLGEEMRRFLVEVMNALGTPGHIVVFGPAYVKKVLGKALDNDARFNTATVDLVTADRMTPDQMVAWVKRYFHPTSTGRIRERSHPTA